jgi:hypothetical protein
MGTPIESMDKPTQKPPHLVVHQGGEELGKLDMTYLLEEMDLRDALPLLQALGRRMKPAANSPLELVEASPLDRPERNSDHDHHRGQDRETGQ